MNLLIAASMSAVAFYTVFFVSVGLLTITIFVLPNIL